MLNYEQRVKVLYAVEGAGTNGSSIDTIKMEGPLSLGISSTGGAAGDVTFKLQHSEDGSSWSDVTDGSGSYPDQSAVYGLAFVATNPPRGNQATAYDWTTVIADDSEVQLQIVPQKLQRYIRAVFANGDANTLNVAALSYNQKYSRQAVV